MIPPWFEWTDRPLGGRVWPARVTMLDGSPYVPPVRLTYAPPRGEDWIEGPEWETGELWPLRDHEAIDAVEALLPGHCAGRSAS